MHLRMQDAQKSLTEWYILKIQYCMEPTYATQVQAQQNNKCHNFFTR